MKTGTRALDDRIVTADQWLAVGAEVGLLGAGMPESEAGRWASQVRMFAVAFPSLTTRLWLLGWEPEDLADLLAAEDGAGAAIEAAGQGWTPGEARYAAVTGHDIACTGFDARGWIRSGWSPDDAGLAHVAGFTVEEAVGRFDPEDGEDRALLRMMAALRTGRAAA